MGEDVYAFLKMGTLEPGCRHMISPDVLSDILVATRDSSVKLAYFGSDHTSQCQVMALAEGSKNTASMLKGKRLDLYFCLLCSRGETSLVYQVLCHQL